MNSEIMNQDFWEGRYQRGDTDWDKGAPSPGLVDFLAAHPALPHGAVCVPGCGTGSDARAWAQAGFVAWGFDIAPTAIRLAGERAKRAGVPSCFAVTDFLRDDPPQPFDWVFEHMLFSAIDPASRDDYVRAVLRWLKPEGQYLAVNYLFCDPGNPPFPTTRQEQWERFSPQFDLLEEWVPRSYPNRTGKERMFWWRRRRESPKQTRKKGRSHE